MREISLFNLYELFHAPGDEDGNQLPFPVSRHVINEESTQRDFRETTRGHSNHSDKEKIHWSF